MARIYKTGIIITGDAKGGVRAVRATSSEIKRLEQSQKRGYTAAKRYNSVFAEMKALLPALGVGILAGQVLDAGIKMQGFERAFNSATGSVANGAKELEFVRFEAQRLGLDFESVAGSYVQLAAASKGTVLEGEKTRDIFTAISEASSVLNLSADQTEGALRAIQQMMSKGKVQAEELRGQLGERLPGAFQLAAEAMGVTTAELNKMLEQGEVLAEDLLPELARVLKERYSEAAKEAATQTRAAVNRMKTDWFEFKAELADAGAMDIATSAVEGVSVALKTLTDNLPALISGFQNLTIAVAAVAGARILGPLFAKVASQVGLASLAVRIFALDVKQVGLAAALTGKTMGGFNKALALIGGPAGAAILAAGGLYLLSQRETDAEEATRLLEDATSDLNTILGDSKTVTSDAAQEKVKLTQQHYQTAKAALEEAEAQLELQKAIGLTRKEGGLGLDFVTPTKNIAKLREAVEKGERSLKQYISTAGMFEITITGAGEAAGDAGEGVKKLTKEQREAAKAAKAAAREQEAFAKSVNDLLNELDPVRAAAQEYEAKQRLLNEAIKQGVGDASELKAALEELRTEHGKLNPELQDTYDKYFPLQKAAREYKEEIERLNELLRQGVLDQEAYDEALEKSRKEYENTQVELKKTSEEFTIFGRTAGEILIGVAEGSFDFKDAFIASMKEIAVKGIDLLLKKLAELAGFDWGVITEGISSVFSSFSGGSDGGFDLGNIAGLIGDVFSGGEVDLGGVITNLTSNNNSGGGSSTVDTIGDLYTLYDTYQDVTAAIETYGAATEASSLIAGEAASTYGELAIASEAGGTATAGWASTLETAGVYAAAAAISYKVFGQILGSNVKPTERVAQQMDEINDKVAAGEAQFYGLAEGVKASGGEYETFYQGSGPVLRAMEEGLQGLEGIRTFTTTYDGGAILKVWDDLGRGIDFVSNQTSAALESMGGDFSAFAYEIDTAANVSVSGLKDAISALPAHLRDQLGGIPAEIGASIADGAGEGVNAGAAHFSRFSREAREAKESVASDFATLSNEIRDSADSGANQMAEAWVRGAGTVGGSLRETGLAHELSVRGAAEAHDKWTNSIYAVGDAATSTSNITVGAVAQMTQAYSEFGKSASEDGEKLSEAYVGSTARMTQAVLGLGDTSNHVTSDIVNSFDQSGESIVDAVTRASSEMSSVFTDAAGVVRDEATGAAIIIDGKITDAAQAAADGMVSFGGTSVSELLHIISTANSAAAAIRNIPSAPSSGDFGGAPSKFDGINYVPYDGFKAVLHKGEAVIPAKRVKAAQNRNQPAQTHVVDTTPELIDIRRGLSALSSLVADQTETLGNLINNISGELSYER